MTEKELEIAEAWAEHEAAHDEYWKEKQQLRDTWGRGVLKKRWARAQLKPQQDRLTAAWMRLHELGEVELTPPHLPR